MMRKSHQGARRVSQPMRMDLDDLRASSSRRTLDARRGTGIPLPKGRRSSSENRNNRMSALQPMKRSRSQNNMNLVTPVQNSVTPLRGCSANAFGSAQSQRFVSPFSDGGRSSRMSTYSGAGGSKQCRVAKDTRPMTDKSFQQQEIQKITSFLFSQPDALTFAPKGINLRQLTMKLFVDIVNYLISFQDDDIGVNMTNYVTEIPIIMKKWGYVGNLNTSWLKTVNTPHALPHVLGLLSWLTSLASAVVNTDVDSVIQDALQHEREGDEESFLYGNAAVYIPHLVNQYSFWSAKDELAEENEEAKFIQALCSRNGVSDEELREIAENVHKYEMQLDDPKEKAEIEAAQEEEKMHNELLKDYNICSDYKSRMEEYINTAETDLENEKLKLKNEEEAFHSIQNSIMELKDQLGRQLMTVQERDNILKVCSELSIALRENEEYISVVSNQIYSVDLEMAKKRNSVKKKTQAFNKVIVTESCWLPELASLKDDTNILHIGAQEVLAELDARARKLRSDQQKKIADLTSQIRQLKADLLQVEERKNLVLYEKEQYSEKMKQSEESINAIKSRSAEETSEMKRTIDSLKVSNEARINCGSLEEAKVKLQKLFDKREYGRTHLEKSRKKAKAFFSDSVAITQGLINRVTKAEEEYVQKRDELVKNTQSKLQKTRNEVDQLKERTH